MFESELLEWTTTEWDLPEWHSSGLFGRVHKPEVLSKTKAPSVVKFKQITDCNKIEALTK